MVSASKSIDRPPLAVRLIDPLARRLLRFGMPMGPNTLLTSRGRRSGQPRSAAVAVVVIGGRRWVISAFGETHWVRNLRASREALLRVDGRNEPVHAVELTPTEAAAFFRQILLPYLDRLPLLMRIVSRIFTRDILADPEGTAARRPVFELLFP